VINSPWLREVQATNSVHSGDRPEQWDAVKHFVLWFHDSTFECLAEALSAEVVSESMEALLTRVARKLALNL
jgi:hypothetical protein